MPVRNALTKVTVAVLIGESVKPEKGAGRSPKGLTP